MPAPEWIGLAERLADGRTARRRPLIRPDEHIAQKLDPMELVHAKHRVRVQIARQIGEREREKFVLMNGMFAAIRGSSMTAG